MHGTQQSETSSPSAMQKLQALRALGGTRRTTGLADEVLQRFLATDPTLTRAIDRAFYAYEELAPTHADFFAMDEAKQITVVQDSIVNFYGDALINPYVALGAGGPWIVTAKGAVLHDSGGYGMLGQGHTPEGILKAMGQPHVMANVMTPHFAPDAPDQGAEGGDRAPPRERLPLHRLPLHEQWLGVGDGRRPDRRRQREDPRPTRTERTPGSTSGTRP